MAGTSFDDALALHQSGRIAAAEAIYRLVLQQQPDHPGALHLLGVIRQQQGDFAAALELIGRAISVNPRKAVYHNNYGAAFQSLGRHEEAAECFQRALAIAPKYADALSNLGMARASLGEDAAAVASFRAALAVQPGHADAMRQLASLVQHLGLGDEAVRLYEETLTHCSAAALAAPFRKLRVFADNMGTSTSRQSASTGPASFGPEPVPVLSGTTGKSTANGAASRDEGETIRYDGRNPCFEVTRDETGGKYDCHIHRARRDEIRHAERDAYGQDPPVTSRAAGTAVPLISVIMPVFNGAATVERALRSLLAQTFRDWEAVAVDDASQDGTWELLQAAAEDSRIRTVRLAENSGPSAARNAALRLAGGEFIAYLDADDEYYPDYLARIAAAREKGDVLMFGFDVVYEDGAPRGRAQDWDSRHVRRTLFCFNPVVPLAAAHRRSLVDRVGGFHGLISQQEDWDLWKRMARAGAKFAFLPGKSGVYHVRPGTLSHVRRLTARQRATIMANWAAGRPIFQEREPESSNVELQGSPHPTPLPEGAGATRPHPNPSPAGEGTICPNPLRAASLAGRGGGTRKIAFVAPHCLIDFTSEAATGVLDGLQLLGGAGFECQAFCGTLPNHDGQEVTVEEMLARRKSPHSVRGVRIGPFDGRMIFTAHGGMPITLFQPVSPRGTWRDEEEVAAFLTACELFLKKQPPDAAWTYGDDPVSCEVIKLLKRLDIPVVFSVPDLAHRNTRMFLPMDYVVVPSEFARRHYWEALGLACEVLPPVVVDWTRVEVEEKAEGGRRKAEGGIENRDTTSPHPNPLRGTRVASRGEGTTRPHPGSLPARDRNDLPSPPASFPSTGEESFVTFVNPQATKGLYVFVRIAEQLAARRPDIPLLVMAGRSRTGWQQETGIDLSRLPNLTTQPSVPDPREFYAATRLLLMPSLWNESFGLVAAEAMLNGIPVLASNRGALPETIGDAGLLFDIPARYTPETRDLPTAEEVAPWVEAIIRLWDDAGEYEHWSRAARERARQWHPDRLAPIYREFFGSITHQPGPPLAPQPVAWQATPEAMSVSAVVIAKRGGNSDTSLPS